MANSNDAWMGRALKGHRIRVEYEQYFIYGRADRKVNNAITFEQSVFSEIHELQTSEVSCVGTTLRAASLVEW